MTRSRQAMMVAAAGLGGFLLGFVSLPREKAMSGGATADGTAAEKSAQRTGARLVFRDATNPLKPEGARTLLELVRNGGKKETADALWEVTTNPALPSALADIYRDALIARLVKLGAVAELLEPGRFPAWQRQEMVNATIKVLAAKDPDAALAVMKRLAPAERKNAAPSLFNTLGRTNPKRGLALLDSDASPELARDSFFSGWAKRDPEAALAEAYARGEKYSSEQRSALNAWTMDDADAAWQWIVAQPAAIRAEARGSWFEALAWSNPDRALKALSTTPELVNDTSAAYAAEQMGYSIASNAKDAAAAVDMLPPGQARSELISGISRTLVANPSEALAWIHTLLPGERQAALNGFFETMGVFDPSQALDLAQSELDGQQRQEATAAILSGWAFKDSDAAFHAMVEKLKGDDLREALSLYFQRNRGTDDSRELAAISKLDPADRAEAFKAKGSASASSLNDDALAQIAKLDPADRQAFAAGALSRGYGIPGSAIGQLAAMLPPTKQAELASTISRAMARTSYADAAAFLLALPQGGNPGSAQSAMSDLVNDWVFVEPAAAIAFTQQLPAGNVRNRASQNLVRQLSTFDLETATQVALRADPQARGEMIEALASNWAKVDAERGREAIAPLLQSKEDRARASALFGKP